MENSHISNESSNFGKNVSFIIDHDSGYMSSESNARPEEKFIISEIIPTADHNSENAVDGNSGLTNWNIVTTSFINVVNKESLISTGHIQPNPASQIVPVTPKKAFINPIDPGISPDLFADEEAVQNCIVVPIKEPTTLKRVEKKEYIVKKDYLLVKRVTNSLKGVIPPHSMTVVQFTIDEMLNKIETNKDYFWNFEKVSPSDAVVNTSKSSDDGYKSLLITGIKDIVDKEWPKILEGRYHGLQ